MAFKDIKGKVFLLRGQVVMLDYNLAELYGVSRNSVLKALKNSDLTWYKSVFTITDEEWRYAPTYMEDIVKYGGLDSPVAFTSQAIVGLSFILRQNQQVQTSLMILNGYMEIYNVDPELYNRLDIMVVRGIRALHRFQKREREKQTNLSPPIISTEYLHNSCKNKFTVDTNGLIRNHHQLYAYLYPTKCKMRKNNIVRFHIFVCEQVQNNLSKKDIDSCYRLSSAPETIILDIVLNKFRKDIELCMCNRCRNLLQKLISRKTFNDIDFTPIIHYEDVIQKHITNNKYIKMMNKV